MNILLIQQVLNLLKRTLRALPSTEAALSPIKAYCPDGKPKYQQDRRTQR